MDTTLFLVGVVPLIAFVIIDIYAGTKAGVYAAIGIGLALFGYYCYELQEIDELLALECSLLLVLGIVTINLNNSVFFKFQPVVVAAVLCAFLTWFQLFDEPYLVKILPRMIKLMPSLGHMVESNPLLTKLLSTLSWQLIVLFFIHGGLVAYAALKMKNIAWLLMRLAIYPMLIALMIIDTIFLARTF